MSVDRKTFLGLLATEFYPKLRADGFRGSNPTLRRINEPVIHLINAQGSQGGKHFYFNIGVHFTFLSDSVGRVIDQSKLEESQCAFRDRIVPPHGMHNWLYGATEEEAKKVIAQITEEWKIQAQPFYSKYYYPDGLLRLINDIETQNLHPTHMLTFSRIAIHLGLKDRAMELATLALEKVPPRATGLLQNIKELLEGNRIP